MILFELYRELDERFYKTISVLDNTFVPCAKYLLIDDVLIALGVDYSVRFNASSGEALVDNPASVFGVDNEPCQWFALGSGEGRLIEAISDAFRQWKGIDPRPDYEDFLKAINAINQDLSKYELTVLCDENGLGIYHERGVVTFEQAIEIIWEMDADINQNVNLEQVISTAQFYKQQGQLADAVPYYENVLKNTSRSELLYTMAAFELAECYYFIGNYDRAVSLYYRCNLDFLADENDFYIHVGHALLDSKMKKYEREIKIFYRAQVDPDYVLTHREAVNGAQREIKDVFPEYEKTCLDMGKKKYTEHRNHLPVGADDVDEILLSDDGTEGENKQIKPYLNIKLVEPSRQYSYDGISTPELFEKAMDYLISGDYQYAYEIYYRLAKAKNKKSDYYTWANFQLGKIFCMASDYKRASERLIKCNINRLNDVYRQDDFFVLYRHVENMLDNACTNVNYPLLIRGRYDFYYSENDENYKNLLKKHQLIRQFVQYEKECADLAKEDYADVLSGLVNPDEEKEPFSISDFIESVSDFFKNLFSKKDVEALEYDDEQSGVSEENSATQTKTDKENALDTLFGNATGEPKRESDDYFDFDEASMTSEPDVPETTSIELEEAASDFHKKFDMNNRINRFETESGKALELDFDEKLPAKVHEESEKRTTGEKPEIKATFDPSMKEIKL